MTIYPLLRVRCMYRRRVRCVLTGSRGRVSESWRTWLVLRLPGGRLEAIGISERSARALRKAGVPYRKTTIHELRGGLPLPRP